MSEDKIEELCREAYNDMYHKVRADISYDSFKYIWKKCIEATNPRALVKEPDLYIAYNEAYQMTSFGSNVRSMVNDHINDRTGLSDEEPMARLIAVDFRKELP